MKTGTSFTSGRIPGLLAVQGRTWITALATALALATFSCGEKEQTLAPLIEDHGGIVAGTVLVQGAGPAANVAVSLEEMSGGFPLSVSVRMQAGASASSAFSPAVRVTTTDAHGRFAFDRVAPGEYLASSTARDHRGGMSRITVPLLEDAARAETTFVDIQLVPTGTFTGSAVLVNESVHRNTVVYVEGESNVALTDEAGRYILRDVPIGARTLRATRAGWRDATAAGTLSAAGDSVEVASMMLQPDLNIDPTVTASAPDVGNTFRAFPFDGIGTDVDGTIVRYEWDFTDDGTIDWSGTSATTTHLFTAPGLYRAKLRAVDDRGGVGLSTVSFRIYDAYYVATDGSNDNPGSRDLPLRTIQRGLDLAAGNCNLDVKVAIGTYSESITLPDSCTLRAGCNRDTWIPAGVSVVETGSVPLLARDLTKAGVKGLDVRAANPTGSPIALVVDHCLTQSVEFMNCRFESEAAPAGASGAAGANGANGEPGEHGSGQSGGGDGWGSGGYGGEPPWGNGQPGTDGEPPLGGAGGLMNGGDGGDAAWATAGAHGSATLPGGDWVGYSWAANAGNPGTAGQDGGQGGGGGGGNAFPGFSGGGGGEGGHGGGGGQGGSGGGAGPGSFAVVVMNGTNILFSGCTFKSGNAGAGGAGGNGGVGGDGGPGGIGSTGYGGAGSGGDGGLGTAGAAAGGGSGGGGGWSYAVYMRAGATCDMDDAIFIHGSPGVGGLGGLRGGSVSRAPSGPNGQSGDVYRE